MPNSEAHQNLSFIPTLLATTVLFLPPSQLLAVFNTELSSRPRGQGHCPHFPYTSYMPISKAEEPTPPPWVPHIQPASPMSLLTEKISAFSHLSLWFALVPSSKLLTETDVYLWWPMPTLHKRPHFLITGKALRCSESPWPARPSKWCKVHRDPPSFVEPQ